MFKINIERLHVTSKIRKNMSDKNYIRTMFRDLRIGHVTKVQLREHIRFSKSKEKTAIVFLEDFEYTKDVAKMNVYYNSYIYRIQHRFNPERLEFAL